MAGGGAGPDRRLLLAVLGRDLGVLPIGPGAAAPVTLVFKHAISGSRQSIPKLIAEFEARHPACTFRPRRCPGTATAAPVLRDHLEVTARAFDVMMLDVIWVPEFRALGWLSNLTPPCSPRTSSPVLSFDRRAATYARRVWGMPWNMNVGCFTTSATFSTILPETARDWTRSRAQAERIRAAERNPRLDGVLWQGKQYEA